MNVPKIIVIDDDLATSQLIATALQLEGFQSESITRVANDDIMALLDSHQPDGLILDFHLQTEETLKYMEKIRNDATWHRLPVIMMSGINRRRQCEQAGASGFILKPFDWQELATTVNRIIEKNK